MAMTLDGSSGVTTNAGGLVNPSTTIDGINYSCRAWVNFNGTGTPAIRASGNVMNITDNGTGDYNINFITAMTDTSFAPNVSANIYTTAHATIGIDTFTTLSFRIRMEQNAVAVDSNLVCVSVFR